MKTLIVYASKHGCAKKAAGKIALEFGVNTEVMDVRNITRIDLEDFDRIIIGGSIHAGRIQKQIRTFTRRHLDLLLQKQIGLYICHMEQGDRAMKELTDNFPVQLLDHAAARGLFGGEFVFEKMNFLEKFIIKKVAKVSASESNINQENIENFINTLKETEKQE